MGLILAIDDLSPGMFVAIHSLGHPRMFVVNRGPVGIEVEAPPPSAPVMPGVPLQVLCVSLPFAACSVLEPGGGHGGPVILDLRHVRLCSISGEFVAAIATFGVEDEGDKGADEPELSLFQDITPGGTEE